jgi:hypothetical protein
VPSVCAGDAVNDLVIRVVIAFVFKARADVVAQLVRAGRSGL